jgi:Domain of unknown function (DUF4265)
MPQYVEHPSRATTLRNGEFVVLPDALAEDCTVWFAVEPGDQDGGAWEGLLARRLADDRVRICAVPHFAYDVNLGDEVSVIASGALVATRVVKDAGNYTFRVAFDRSDDPHDARWRGLMVDLEPYDCWFDPRHEWLVAISVGPEHAQAVADYLGDRERRGELNYETGRMKTDGPAVGEA